MVTWSIILIGVTVGLVLLPLVPAMIELYFPKDDKPLRVVQAYDGDIHHFAKGFRRYIDDRLTPADKALESITDPHISNSATAKIASEIKELSSASKNIRQVIISQFPLQLPADTFYESEVYSARQINAGRNSFFRSILSKSNVYLENNCSVLRWVHSDSSLFASIGCKLFGRASAHQKIQLGEKCEFERLQSPRIEFGTTQQTEIVPLIANENQERVSELSGVKIKFGRRWLMSGAFNFPSNKSFDGDIIAKTFVDIGSHSRIDGSVKSNGDAILGEQVTINGALISAEELAVGRDCHIKGPVIAEKSLHIASGTVIGSEASPTSVTAPHITVEAGVIIFGSIWATDKGIVEADKRTTNEASS